MVHAVVGRSTAGVDASPGGDELVQREDADRHGPRRRRLQVQRERVGDGARVIGHVVLDLHRRVPRGELRVRQLRPGLRQLAEGRGQVGLRRLELIVQDQVAPGQGLVGSLQRAEAGLVARVVGVKHPDRRGGNHHGRHDSRGPQAPLAVLEHGDPTRGAPAEVGVHSRLGHLAGRHDGSTRRSVGHVWPGLGHTP